MLSRLLFSLLVASSTCPLNPKIWPLLISLWCDGSRTFDPAPNRCDRTWSHYCDRRGSQHSRPKDGQEKSMRVANSSCPSTHKECTPARSLNTYEFAGRTLRMDMVSTQSSSPRTRVTRKDRGRGS